MWSFRRLFPAKRRLEPIIVVSGLPRSGTSMLMKMLEAGGMEIFSDGLRQSDEDNPKGYFEFERIKNLHKEKDKSWLAETRGKAVKIISDLLTELPGEHRYKIIFMHRDLDEVIASQNKMLTRRGESLAQDDQKIRELFSSHLRRVGVWLRKQSNIEVVDLHYREILDDPLAQAQLMRRFLDLSLDAEKMAQAVDSTLYRNRR
ncbi:MAG: sulfotransferase [Acidobacteriota bacterium]